MILSKQKLIEFRLTIHVHSLRSIDCEQESLFELFIFNQLKSIDFPCNDAQNNKTFFFLFFYFFRNIVYNLSISDLSEQRRLVWHSPENDVKMCVMKGKDDVSIESIIIHNYKLNIHYGLCQRSGKTFQFICHIGMKLFISDFCLSMRWLSCQIDPKHDDHSRY